MKFKDLLLQVKKEDIIDYFNKKDDEYKYIDKYCEVYDDLLNRKNIVNTDFQLFLVYQKDYFDEVDIISVFGYDETDNEHYALDFMERNRWLGCNVLEKSLKEFGPVTFVCECLYEMTFISFDEGKVEEEKAILDERVKEIENGTVTYVSEEELHSYLTEKLGWEVKEVTIDEKEKENRYNKTKEIYEYNKKKIEEILG